MNMAEPPFIHSKYIAAGCLVVKESRSGVPEELQQWRWLQAAPDHDNLPVELPRCIGLLRNEWIQLCIRTSLNNPALAVVRVYVLPDDIDNCAVPRNGVQLRAVRHRLMKRLDYSKSTWHGEVGYSQPTPARFAQPDPTADAAEDPWNQSGQSLLHMFNSIPSPDPNPSLVDDFYAHDAMCNLLESRVLGLKTSLYPHQRRSAALMLQRELAPQRMADPRLDEVLDQNGTVWYYDSVNSTVLREPRYYDGPTGGILAEDMGSGKTLICIALILATRDLPSRVPDMCEIETPTVTRIRTLADMAAACITRNAVPWRSSIEGGPGLPEYGNCMAAIRRNRGYYFLRPDINRRASVRQQMLQQFPDKKIYLSHANVIIVPPNLVEQWENEITKHTTGLKERTVIARYGIPPVAELIDCDIVLLSSSLLEHLFRSRGPGYRDNPLSQVLFKRCIVDEGHKLGNSTLGYQSDLHLAINELQIMSRWVVTGTPSKGLYSVDGPDHLTKQWTAELEKEDLKRLGSLASLYLQVRPWANTKLDSGDSPADWNAYILPQRKTEPVLAAHRAERLKRTLEIMMIRHNKTEIGNLLPTVNESYVYLDGSYQDILVLNLFSMMIIFNSVESQRTDQDFLFHPRQRKALMELTSNLRQSSFFGGSFFSPAEITKAVDTAETFLQEGKVEISTEDETLLREAIKFGRLAERNSIKQCANLFREVPVYLSRFPFGAGKEWSLDLKGGDPVLTDSRLVLELQKFLHQWESDAALEVVFRSGQLARRGETVRAACIEAEAPDDGPTANQSTKLAGNTGLGQDHNGSGKRRPKMAGPEGLARNVSSSEHDPSGTIADCLSATQLISTTSAKLSYMVDQIMKYQSEEQIIVFYENDNVAYYLAGVLEMLQVHHLIYAKGLSIDRRARYVSTFNNSTKFRVLLMDITLAAFGLDMRSASRIYFLNPVLNPQIEAQAIGRARRIGQNKPVTVETLVLRGTIEEKVVQRRGEMSQAEQWKCRSLLDDRPIYEWVRNARILPLPGGEHGEGLGGPEQMAPLKTPQWIFGRGFGRAVHPDQDLVVGAPEPLRAAAKRMAAEMTDLDLADIVDRPKKKAVNFSA
ncbi:DNA repair protein rad8 [Echria macrotheca]|uniref:DNA repair protein rad8 n=1 Tax=Echria macrotheca TaxID=438768 RepID=A0AAJ0F7X3_9PEZI|nr:DNA repair protein rad8 [Echria macrotheca]